MIGFGSILGAWLREFVPFFVGVLPRWVVAWLITLVVLVLLFRGLKPRLRTQAARFDESMRKWARRLRYRVHELLEPDQPHTERHLLTWFFRFWTNFASAPSLSVLAFAIPIWFFWAEFNQIVSAAPSQLAQIAGSFLLVVTGFSGKLFDQTKLWLLPTFCYFGSMGLSYVFKRVFNRLRPVREEGAFGHRLKDGSFPSGHSLTAFCFWVPMIFVVSHHTASVFATAAFAVVAVAIVIFTGMSRIYMAVHWPSDVAGGFVIGTVWTAFFMLACAGLFL